KPDGSQAILLRALSTPRRAPPLACGSEARARCRRSMKTPPRRRRPAVMAPSKWRPAEQRALPSGVLSKLNAGWESMAMGRAQRRLPWCRDREARVTVMADDSMAAQVSGKDGFIAALDQSGGSTPGALRLYGIPESAYSGEAELFRLMHE